MNCSSVQSGSPCKATQVKVIFVVENLELGGVQRVFVNLAKGLCADGYHVAIAPFRVKGALRDELEGIEIIRLPGTSVWNLAGYALKYSADRDLLKWVRLRRIRKVLRYSRALVGLLKENQPAIIFSGDMFGNCSLTEARRLVNDRGLKIVPGLHSHAIDTSFGSQAPATVAGGTSPDRKIHSGGPWPAAYVMRCLRQADEVVAVSRGLADEARALLGEEKGVTTIYNPVVDKRLRNLAECQPDHPWLLDKGLPVVISVGRFGPHKDFLFLLEAFARIQARIPSRLVLVGYNPDSSSHMKYKAALQSRAKTLGVHDRLALLPATDNPYALMKAADVYALSSPAEGFGTALVEALYCGLGVVSTDCPSGPREILAEGKFGQLVPVGDIDAFADALVRSLNSAPDKPRLKARAEHFSLERALGQYEGLIDSLIAEIAP